MAANVDPNLFASSTGSNVPIEVYVDPTTGQQFAHYAAYKRTGVNGQGQVQSVDVPASWVTIATGPNGQQTEATVVGPPATAQKAVLGQGGQIVGMTKSVFGSPGSIGFGFGASPSSLAADAASLLADNKAAIGQATAAAQGQLTSAANNAFSGGTGVLNNAYQTSAAQRSAGAQGLAQAQALADYNTQLGAQAAQGLSALGADANSTGASYRAQANGLLGQQQDIAGAGLAQLAQLRAESNRALAGLRNGADTSQQLQQYYGSEAANYGAQAAGTQGQAAGQFAHLAYQGAADQATLYGLGGQANLAANYYGSEGAARGAQAQALAGATAGGYAQLAGQGRVDQANLNAIGNASLQEAGNYGQLGRVNTGFQIDDRGRALDALGRLQSFYSQGAGPSAAQAQLALQSDQNQAGAISLANSGRGAGQNAQALRSAIFSNAATQQTTNLQMAQLRAQEEAQWRQTQLSGMNTEQGAIGALRGQDIGAAGAAAQLSQAFTGLGQQSYAQGAQLGQGALGAASAGLSTLTAQQLQAQQAAAQTSQGMATLGGNLYAQGAQFGQAGTLGAAQGLTGLAGQQVGQQGQAQNTAFNYGQLANQYTSQAGTLGLQANTAAQSAYQGWGNQALTGAQTATAAGAQYAGIGADYYKAGQTAQLGYNQNANSVLSTGLGYSQGMQGLANQSDASGISGYTTMNQQGNTMLAGAAGAGMQGAGAGIALDAANQSYLAGLYHDQSQLDLSQRGIDAGIAVQQQARSDANTNALITGATTIGGGLIGLFAGGPAGAAAGATLGAAGGRALSDIREKMNIRAQAFDLRPAKGFAYEYKDPAVDGAADGVHFGPMAQDLLKSPATRATVQKGEDGRLRVDTPRLTLALTSAVGQEQTRGDALQKRIKRLEALLEKSS